MPPTVSATSPIATTATPHGDTSASFRRAVYFILIALSVGNMLGRIFAVNSVDAIGLEKYLKAKNDKNWQKSRPFLSANDRSRWATVRSLVELGTYEIDDIIVQPGWDTIDMVKHVGADGKEHLYSSKPPLIATLMAGEYWLIHKLTGATLGDHPYEIGRFMLVSINVTALAVYFIVLAKLAERIGTTDWGRVFVMAAATFGTFLTTFAVSINNHVISAVCAAISVWAAVRIWYDGERRPIYFGLVGLFCSLAFATELPALSLLAALGVGLLWKAPRLTLLAFAPAALLGASAHYGLNYYAHGSLREPYAHRSKDVPADNWYQYTYERGGKTIDSYWKAPQGIDKGEASTATYLLHTTIGHHGIFSLTPVWLLSVAGVVLLARRGWRELAVLIGTLSLVCFCFYLSLDKVDRNYGGMTSGLRWMFWFAPMWLIAMLPAADSLSRTRFGRGIALVLLAASALSAAYPIWNPWVQPWIMNLGLYEGWIVLP